MESQIQMVNRKIDYSKTTPQEIAETHYVGDLETYLRNHESVVERIREGHDWRLKPEMLPGEEEKIAVLTEAIQLSSGFSRVDGGQENSEIPMEVLKFLHSQGPQFRFSVFGTKAGNRTSIIVFYTPAEELKTAPEAGRFTPSEVELVLGVVHTVLAGKSRKDAVSKLQKLISSAPFNEAMARKFGYPDPQNLWGYLRPVQSEKQIPEEEQSFESFVSIEEKIKDIVSDRRNVYSHDSRAIWIHGTLTQGEMEQIRAVDPRVELINVWQSEGWTVKIEGITKGKMVGADLTGVLRKHEISDFSTLHSWRVR
jgi:hypothetical protein